MKLNLGSSGDYLEGWWNLDIRPRYDFYQDLNLHWDLSDNQADEIRAYDVVEHLDSVLHFMHEAHRVLKEGGILKIRVPSARGKLAWLDPTHKRAFELESFDYFDFSTFWGNKYRYGDGWSLTSRQEDGDNLLFYLVR